MEHEVSKKEKATKKYLIILILRILETESDVRNPLTQIKIAEMISRVYPCDRKTVGRNIAFLKELGYPIVKNGKGFYMDKLLFTREEINFVISSVASSGVPCGTAVDREDLCERLNLSLSRYYKERGD